VRTYAFIFARGGSKGVPRKNILELNGKPLLAYSIELALNISDIDDVFVSTDDDDIAKVAIKFGANIIRRPSELAQDSSPEWLAWKHAISWLEERSTSFDRFISLPATAPLRSEKDIVNCLERLGNETDVVITVSETTHSPFFNMVKKIDGYVKLVSEDKDTYVRRQDVPKVYNMTTVAYVARPEFIMRNNNIFDGRVKSVIIPNDRAIDIDTMLDFEIAEMLIKKKEPSVIQ